MKKFLFYLWIYLAATWHNPLFALNVQKFNPTPKNHETLSAPGSLALAPGKIYVSAFANYVRNPLEFGLSNSGTRVTDLVNGIFTVNSLIGVGIFPRVDFEVDLPVHLLNEINVGASGLQDQENFVLGDLLIRSTITLKKRELRKEGPWGIALVPFVTIPLNSDGDFLNDNKFTVGGHAVFDKWVSDANFFALSAGFKGRKEEDRLLNLAVNHEILFNLSYVGKLSANHFIDVLADLKGSTTVKKPFSEHITTPIELDVALRKLWQAGWGITVGAGRGLTNGYSAPDFRVFAGLTYQIPMPSGDNQENKSNDNHQSTTPPPPVVGKGMLTITIKDESGVDVPAELLVRAEVGKFSERKFGSAWEKELSAGNYQISVQAPGYLWSFREVTVKEGEPTRADITLVSAQAGSKIEVLGTIMFDLNKATLKSESFTTLDHVVETLQKNTGVSKVRVDAHTDSQGTEVYNLDLSARRAKTVYDYLVEKGIDANRLETKGWGESSPIDSNDTVEGRAKNRRVEFVILETDSDAVKGAN